MFNPLKYLAGFQKGKEKPVETSAPEILQICYQDLYRLAEQIDHHAEKAPYPYIARQLRTIAEEKRSSAGLLKNEISKRGSQRQHSARGIKSGNNNWERITRDLEDQSELESQLLKYAAVLGEEAPEISALLKAIVAQQAPHRTSLLNILARADPQANLSGL